MSETNIPALPNCLSQSAFTVLDTDSSKAPILRYSIPQKSEFTAYGHTKLPLAFTKFRGDSLPAVDAIATNGDAVRSDLLFMGDSRFVANAGLLQVSQTHSVQNADYTPNLYAQQWTGIGGNILTAYNQNGLPLSTNNNDIAARTIDPNGDGSDPTIDPELSDVTSVDTNNVAHDDFDDYIANEITHNYQAFVHVQGMGRIRSFLRSLRRPLSPDGTRFEARPTLFIVEEYRVASFLGGYGAGKTLNTFSLLPGEKTTITVKTFKEITSSKTSSQNIIDSFSESSGQEMENLLQEEANMQTTLNTSNQQSSSSNKSSQTGVSASASGGFFGINFSASANHSSASESAVAANQSTAAGRSTNVKNLSNAMAKHVQNSNSNREVTINSNTQDSYTESVETGIVRELANPNQSRVLNFVFRQLLQEYVTLTYLADIKVAFSNGHPESFRIVSLAELDLLLYEVLNTSNTATYVEEVKEMLRCAYTLPDSVTNYNGEGFAFLQEVDAPTFRCTTTQRFVKTTNLSDTYSTDGGVKISVPGVILNVDKHVLRTDSVVADALMGQGEALDCFNAHVQEAKKNQLWLEAEKLKLALETLQAIPDPALRAQLYAAMFNPPAPVVTP